MLHLYKLLDEIFCAMPYDGVVYDAFDSAWFICTNFPTGFVETRMKLKSIYY